MEAGLTERLLREGHDSGRGGSEGWRNDGGEETLDL